jgi:5'-nucleotidase (lipoprotein e(P4) family)
MVEMRQRMVDVSSRIELSLSKLARPNLYDGERMNNIRTTFSRPLFCVALLVLAQVFSTAQTPWPSREIAVDNEHQTGAILWTQSSAEYRAIAYQTFALAWWRLDESLRSHNERRGGKTHRSPQRATVIVDADETVLDNSRFQAELVLRGLPYEPQAWRAWCERAEAGAVPGQSISLSMQDEGA